MRVTGTITNANSYIRLTNLPNVTASLVAQGFVGRRLYRRIGGLQTEAEIEAKLEGQPPEFQATILQQWQALKDRQASLYVDFFAIEQELLQAYDNLMSFYYERRDMYTIDPDTLKMNFMQSEDEQSAMEFRAKILELAAREATLLDKQTP